MAEKDESASGAAENTEASTQDQRDDLPQNSVTVEDIGPARVRIKIEIPIERIEARLDSDIDELRRTAVVPGFRTGRAPRRLVEKRFGSETRDRLKNVLIAEALEKAISENEIKTLGEPDLDIDAIEMPEEAPLSFEIETDVEPKFDMPELEGIAVTKRTAPVKDEDVEATIKTMLSREGVYEPLTKGSAEKGDQIIGDLWLKVGDEEITRRDDMALLAGPTDMPLMSVKLNDLCEKFVGAKVGTKVTDEVTIGEEHTNEEARGKQGTAGMDIKEIKRLKIPPLTDEWLKKAGWQGQDEFRATIKNNLERRVEDSALEQMRIQVRQYLLEQTKLDLPENLVANHVKQAEHRQLVRLLQMGVPESTARQEIVKKAEDIHSQAVDEAKVFFILGRIADEYDIGVDDAEINGQIANMAAAYGARPEQVRQRLNQEGQLGMMASQIQERKVLDKLLSQAKVTEAPPESTPEPKPKAKSKAKAKAKKKTSKAKSPSKAKGAARDAATKRRKKPSESAEAPEA